MSVILLEYEIVPTISICRTRYIGLISFASDGGFLSYSGKLVKFGDYYIANTKLYDCDYIGLSPWQEPPKIVNDENGRNTNTKESFIPPDVTATL